MMSCAMGYFSVKTPRLLCVSSPTQLSQQSRPSSTSQPPWPSWWERSASEPTAKVSSEVDTQRARRGQHTFEQNLEPKWLRMVEEMFVSLLYECVHLPHNFRSSFCNRAMISCSIHGVDELCSCGDFFVIHHSWWNNPFMVFGLHEYRPIYRFEASAVKAMRPFLTREFSFPINFEISCIHFVLNIGNITSQYVAPSASRSRSSWCRSRHTWRWESRIISSSRMSSRNHTSNSVLSKDPFSFL